MTSEEAIYYIENMNGRHSDNRNYAEAIEMAISVLVEQQERENPKPLSLDQLLRMRGSWVWVVSPDKDLTVSAWGYVGDGSVFTYWEYRPDSIVGGVAYDMKDYGDWLAYRHKPQGERHDL